VVLVAVQLSLLGLYLPPVFKPGAPPQTIISLSVHTALCCSRAKGALLVVVLSNYPYWSCICRQR